MADLMLVKNGVVFVPMRDEDKRRAASMGNGEMVYVEVFSGSNGIFHRLLMAMFRYGHDRYMEMHAHELGESTVLMGFDEFRKQVMILAGFCKQVFGIDGTFTVESDSLRYSKMEDDRKREVYDKCVDVVLRLILKDHTRDDLDRVVGEFVVAYA